HLPQSNFLRGYGNHRPIARRNFIEVVCGNEPIRTGHVRDDNLWVARNEPTKMARRKVPIEGICAGRFEPDNDPNGLAAGGISASGTVRSQDNGGKGAADCTSAVFNNAAVGRHWFLPVRWEPSYSPLYKNLMALCYSFIPFWNETIAGVEA